MPTPGAWKACPLDHHLDTEITGLTEGFLFHWTSEIQYSIYIQYNTISVQFLVDFLSVQCMSTWHIVSKADRGQRDDHKVERLQKRPVLHFLKHNCWHSKEDQTTHQDGENRWNHTHRGWPDLTFLKGRKSTASLMIMNSDPNMSFLPQIGMDHGCYDCNCLITTITG